MSHRFLSSYRVTLPRRYFPFCSLSIPQCIIGILIMSTYVNCSWRDILLTILISYLAQHHNWFSDFLMTIMFPPFLRDTNWLGTDLKKMCVYHRRLHDFMWNRARICSIKFGFGQRQLKDLSWHRVTRACGQDKISYSTYVHAFPLIYSPSAVKWMLTKPSCSLYVQFNGPPHNCSLLYLML